jgi:hypothetical protein
MSQTLNTVPAFDGSNYGYCKDRMRFFLKSIDCQSIVETGWTKPADAMLELVLRKTHNFLMTKPSMLYVKHFHHLNLQKYQTVNLLKKRGKSWKQHMKARNL